MLLEERFRVGQSEAPPVLVVHWGHYWGGFEYWSVNWYDPGVDMSYAFVLSGAAPGTAALELDLPAHVRIAERLATSATDFAPWTP